jgi:hypothetical protein
MSDLHERDFKLMRARLEAARRAARAAKRLAESIDWDDDQRELLADSTAQVGAVANELATLLRAGAR